EVGVGARGIALHRLRERRARAGEVARGEELAAARDGGARRLGVGGRGERRRRGRRRARRSGGARLRRARRLVAPAGGAREREQEEPRGGARRRARTRAQRTRDFDWTGLVLGWSQCRTRQCSANAAISPSSAAPRSSGTNFITNRASLLRSFVEARR